MRELKITKKIKTDFEVTTVMVVVNNREAINKWSFVIRGRNGELLVSDCDDFPHKLSTLKTSEIVEYPGDIVSSVHFKSAV